jgi:putative transposase
MTEERLVLAELLEKAGDGDFLRAVAEAVLQLLMESDVEGLVGAGRYERSGERTTWRNGYRDRTFDTRLGALQLRIPKLRQGSYFPPFLEARKSSEKALIAVIQEAWIGGVSTRRVDDLVQAMGLSGISKSQVSKLCKEIDERVHAFLDRPLAGEWPYLWLDATYLKQREGGRIVSVAAIIAVAANTDGRREIVGLHIGPSEAETFWSTFLKSLARRGCAGSSSSSPMLMRGSKRRSDGCSAPVGSAAACIGCATPSPMSPRPSRAWWPPRCARLSCSRIGPRRARCCAISPTSSARNGQSLPL